MYRLLSIVALFVSVNSQCTPTTVSGTVAPKEFCSGDLIFEDNFDFLDFKKWEHERTFAGGGNWEFQWYDNNRINSFTRDGVLYVKPSLAEDEVNIYADTVDLHGGAPADACTNPAFYGCTRSGSPDSVVNPVKSARLRSLQGFSFRYGRIEIRAKLPSGDWLWPAIWMLPRYNAFGGWPISGEIDIVESRGNRDLVQNGQNIGTQLVSSTLHWGPNWYTNGYPRTHWERNDPAGFNNDFHLYEVVWTPEYINFYLDGQYLGGVSPPAGGFWELGEFQNTGLPNPWIRESSMAPFNQEFYILINNAVGGTAFFPDDASNPTPKPWSNDSPRAGSDFWEGRGNWLPTWNLAGSDDAALQVDYVRIYAL